MWWRLTRRQFKEQQGEGNRRAMQAIVTAGEVPGILAYLDEAAVGWCAVAPCERYGALERSPVLKRLDDVPVWSIVCLYVAKQHRGVGIGQELIRGAVDYVKAHGGKVVEAYPTIPRSNRLPPVSVYMGLPRMFARAGFTVQAHPSQTKLIMRLTLK